MFSVDKTNSLDAERSLISAALISNKVVDHCSSYLRAADFQDPNLSKVWSVMMAARAEGKPTKFSQLVADGVDAAALAQCQEIVASALGFESYAEKISDASQRRRIVASCMSIIGFCQDSPKSDTFQSEVFDALISSFKDSHAVRDIFSIKESAEQAVKTAIAALQNGGDVSGLPMGYKTLDEKTTGLHPGELIILAARPGMGKTTFALNLARFVSASQQTAFFSMEMPFEQLGGKILSTEVGIGSQDLRTGRIGNRISALKQACINFEKLQLTIFDNSAVTLGYMRSKLHQLEAMTGKPTGLIILDYLQLMGGDSKNENRVQEVSKLSRGLKVLARDFNCPVIALSQLNRSVEQRTDKRPLLSDLRESGSIEQDADMVWFLFRAEYYDTNAPKGETELIIAKQRNGPICTVPLMFDGRLSKFTELQIREEFKQWHS
jgi:replicative DNA helicase